MGRELRRVALDFTWPLGQRWEGFLNPHERLRKECPHCDGTGYSMSYRLLYNVWYGHLFDNANRLLMQALAGPSNVHHEVLRFVAKRLETGKPWCYDIDHGDLDALVKHGRVRSDLRRQGDDRPLTVEEVNATARKYMLHDSINSWVCVSERLKRHRVGRTCRSCRGHGHVPDVELNRKIAAWKPTDPPAGDGYQIWETVSEGSPVSPVFATPEELSDWMVANDDSVTRGTSRDQWLKFINGPGWAPSFVASGGELKSGVESC